VQPLPLFPLQTTVTGLEPQEARGKDSVITIKSIAGVRGAFVGVELTMRRMLPEATETRTDELASRKPLIASRHS
jgi:hypothetical protein